jgi:hypothetical protein
MLDLLELRYSHFEKTGGRRHAISPGDDACLDMRLEYSRFRGNLLPLWMFGRLQSPALHF